MTVDIQRPGVLDVTKSNFREFVYLSGDADTDGSIRLHLDEGETIAHIETRVSGVWNDSSLRFSSIGVLVGRDLILESCADFLKTENLSGFGEHSVAILPHIPFSNTGTLFPHIPLADAVATVIIFDTPVSEISGMLLSQTFSISFAQIIETIIYEVGGTGATDEVVHTVYQGTDNTGTIIAKQTLPASDFVANSSIIVDLDSSVGFSEEHANIFVELSSDTAFSLDTDASNNLIISLTTQKLETRDLLYDDLIFDASLGLVLTSDLNPIYVNQF